MGKVGKCGNTEKLRRGADHARCERSRRNLGETRQGTHIIRRLFRARLETMAHGIVAKQKAVRKAARHSVFVIVDLGEQRALIEFDGAIEIARQFCPGCIEQPDLDLLVAFDLTQKVVDTAPARFQALEILVMQDGIKQIADQCVHRRDIAGQELANSLAIAARCEFMCPLSKPHAQTAAGGHVREEVGQGCVKRCFATPKHGVDNAVP